MFNQSSRLITIFADQTCVPQKLEAILTGGLINGQEWVTSFLIEYGKKFVVDISVIAEQTSESEEEDSKDLNKPPIFGP